jgi:heme/copper-type cytochrome/quinol oxidase subunit 3
MSSAAIEMRDDHLLPPPVDAKAQVGWWGMVVFLLNEGALFASLIASYFYLGVENRFWPPAGTPKPELKLPLIMTAVLLASSVTCFLAEHAHKSGKRATYRAGTLVTMLLGAAFLLIQAREYHNKLQHAGPTDHAYHSIFFTITGLHGVHVAFGVLFLGWALLREWRGTAPPRNPLAIKNASIYWHFVDGVWLTILTSLYLSPRWY